MERLPHEILIEVLSQLPTKDKFTSLSVSKAWNRAAKTCAFNDINVRDPEKLTSAVNYFEGNANLGNQVIDVDISDCKNIYQYLFRLQQLFPNLEAFRWNEMFADVSYDPKTNPTTGIWKKLELIQTTEAFDEKKPSILELILSKYCPNVTQVYADFFDIMSDYAMKNHCIRILNSLKNAPQLSILEFSHLHCAIKNLETLHQNAPNLDKLILSTDTEFSLPDTHTRVLEFAHLSHLEMTFFDSKVSDHYETIFVALFKYIGRKYKGLTYFKVMCNMEHCDGAYLCLIREYFDLDAMEEAILPMFSRCPGLKYYNQMFLPFSNTIAGEMDRCGIQLNKAVFYVETMTMENQLETLSNSQQRLYIEDLTLYQVDEHAYYDEPMKWPASRLAQMVNLKKLWLQGNLDPLCITELVGFLKHLPELEDFQIYNTAVYFIPVDSDLPILALKSLSISWLIIKSKADLQIVDKILETVLPVCPKLEKFGIDFEYKSKREEIDHFTITLDFTTLTELFQVRTPFAADGRRCYYIDSPWTTGYFYQDGKNLVRTESFQPHQFYSTVLLSRPVILDGIIVPIMIDGEIVM